MKYIIRAFVFLHAIVFQEAYCQEAVVTSGNIKSVQARVTDRNGKPVGGIMTYLAVAAPEYQVRTAVSDAEGKVEYLVSDLPRKGQFILQADARSDSNIIFTVEKPFIQSFGTEGDAPGYIFHDSSMFYGMPDKSYLLDDYTRFASLEEVFREFIAEVKISKQGNNFRLNAFNTPFKIFFPSEPLVLLDGVPIFDHNKLMEVDPLKIRRIDVVARKYYLGRLLCNGIVSLFSFDSDLAGYSLPYLALVTEFDLSK